jgi:hypothetical protein
VFGAAAKTGASTSASGERFSFFRQERHRKNKSEKFSSIRLSTAAGGNTANVISFSLHVL